MMNIRTLILAIVMSLVLSICGLFFSNSEQRFNIREKLLYNRNKIVLNYGVSRAEEPVLPGDPKLQGAGSQSSGQEVRRKEILMWTDIKGLKYDGITRFDRCEYTHCRSTTLRSRIAKADAVVMSAYDISVSNLRLPSLHRPWQRWVFLAMEPPVKVNITSQFNNVFNLTATFRDDADFHFKYIQTVPLPADEVGQVNAKENYAAGKSRLAAWMVSHCDAVNRRLDYVVELMKYAQVDVYGHCGPYKCGDKYGWVECRALLDISYKFYLAFENGFCSGYLTEKIWAALTGNVIPIVMGGADYAKYLPPNSFIDVRNFSSPEKLAKYMKLLDENDELYNKYFQWKTSYKLLDERDSPHWCEICKYLHTENKTSTYPNLDKWFNNCVEPDVYYKGVADMLTRKQET